MVWKTGMSGNPGGAATAKPFREALRIELASAGIDQKALRRVARALIGKAYNGDMGAISLLADRLEGKPPQAIGGAEELGPQRLFISWKGQDGDPVAAEAAPAGALAIVAPIVQGND
jgi:hypothetical protein